jgi:hypothetical protein
VLNTYETYTFFFYLLTLFCIDKTRKEIINEHRKNIIKKQINFMKADLRMSRVYFSVFGLNEDGDIAIVHVHEIDLRRPCVKWK